MKLIKNILNVFNFNFNLDFKIKKIMRAGIIFNFIFMLIATLILSIYITTNTYYIVYEIGSDIFRASSMFIAIFFIFGICFNQIIKEKS